MSESNAYVGLDVHKETIAVAVALTGREAPVYRGEIKNQRKSVLKLIKRHAAHRWPRARSGPVWSASLSRSGRYLVNTRRVCMIDEPGVIDVLSSGHGVNERQ